MRYHGHAMLWRRVLLLAGIPVVLFAAQKPADYVGNQACVTCHARQFDSWRKTPMANASGRASEAVLRGSFSHSATRAHFEITESAQGLVLTYRKTASSREEIKGSVQLEYVVGSGTRGRTYLFQREGWWFEAPINWYAKKRLW